MDDLFDDDYTPAYQAWKQDANPKTRGGLLRAVQPTIDTVLKGYGTPSPNLRSQAKLLALKSFDTYDPAKGKLTSHVRNHLQGLQRASAKERNIISLPERVGLEYNGILQAENELRDMHGRDPSAGELADYTGTSLKRLAYLRQSNKPISESALSARVGGNTVNSVIPGTDPGLNPWIDYIYGDLMPMDQVVLDMAMGRNGVQKLPIGRIAAKLNVTAGAVSQRLAKIQALIDRREELSSL